MDEKLIHQVEIFKLGLGLDERGVEYDLVVIFGGLAIVCNSQNWDAVCHKGSYGRGSGLLEVMGRTITGDDDVAVMTAEKVLAKVDELLDEKKGE